MLKYFLLLILFCSCTSPKVSDTSSSSSSDNSEQRVKKITYSVYRNNQKKFLPLYERILSYSEDNNRIEYVELKNGKEINEKHVAEYQDNKMVSLVQSIGGHESRQTYKYNEFGDLTAHVYSTDKYNTQELFVYDDQRLIKHETYDYRDPTNIVLVSEENLIYDSLNNPMRKVYSSPTENKTTEYTFNSKNQITTKSEQYKKYIISYDADTLINIKLIEGLEHEAAITNTRIKFTPDGMLSKIVEVTEWSKEITHLSYDENKYLSEFIYIVEHQNGSKEFDKYEMGPYSIKSKVIFPSWNVDCGLFCNSNYFNILDITLKENQLINSVQNKQSQYFKSIPDYYIVYTSKDGIDWTPNRKVGYEFERTGN